VKSSIPFLCVEIARAEQVDLLAMATHGRGGLSRLVMGSSATGVVHRAEMPVLLVRPVPTEVVRTVSPAKATPIESVVPV
jgi:hypothetical protein